MKNRFKISLKPFQGGDTLRRSLEEFLLVHEDFASVALHQRAQALTHTPAYVSQNLEAIHTSHEKGDTAIAQHTNGFGKALEGLQIESGSVETLELFGRIWHQDGKGQELKAKGCLSYILYRPRSSSFRPSSHLRRSSEETRSAEAVACLECFSTSSST